MEEKNSTNQCQNAASEQKTTSEEAGFFKHHY